MFILYFCMVKEKGLWTKFFINELLPWQKESVFQFNVKRFLKV